MRTRSTILALALTAASPALALDGQVGVGLTFDHRGVRPFAGVNGGVSDRSGVYDGAWISGPGGSAAGASGGGSAAGPAGAPALGGPVGGSLGGPVGGALGGVGGAVGGAAGLTLR